MNKRISKINRNNVHYLYIAYIFNRKKNEKFIYKHPQLIIILEYFRVSQKRGQHQQMSLHILYIITSTINWYKFIKVGKVSPVKTSILHFYYIFLYSRVWKASIIYFNFNYVNFFSEMYTSLSANNKFFQTFN